ncbi:NADP-dependent oxidoreductase [Alkalihalobacterium chitinilyticum]|uniref:NADP-dependent oxidoreductase n=1 Tax=Alkalihalobacterium chitinilyticum TaxID=2980103 RepID=A0ABT5VLI3_9BACI|nr:NADP-dependent oxidoreductase [Alkalihalobacterium chitinilyticum]MDE5416286.1 NADP-dependent oxidoreductase [Alkalihalobacterium chitinilyticum]
MASRNRQILLAQRPNGLPDQSTYSFVETEIPSLEPNEVLVKAQYLSVDPYMRGKMSDAKSYTAPFELNKPLQGGVVGTVIESKHTKFNPGDTVTGLLDWADYTAIDGNQIRKIDPNRAPITTALYVTGMPGLTAYFGLLNIGQPKEGETVVVSGAAGAVGMIVGQIAKIKGCRVVGIAGSDEKNAYLTEELGFDAAINYKTTDNIRKALKEACPNGIDVYFDNVGGEISDAVFSLLNFHARIALCGQIAHYNDTQIEMGPRFLGNFLKRSVLLKGFIVSDYADQYREGVSDLAKWLSEGKIKYKENIVEGLENAPDAFLGLFRGDNLGKQLVKIS